MEMKLSLLPFPPHVLPSTSPKRKKFRASFNSGEMVGRSVSTDPLCWKTRTRPEGFGEYVCSESLYTLFTLIAVQVFSFPVENSSFSTERWSRGTNQKNKKFWCLLLKAVGNKELGYRKNGDREERLIIVGTPPGTKWLGNIKSLVFKFTCGSGCWKGCSL